MWVARSDDGGTWLSRPGPRIAEIIGESGYFGTAVETSYSTRLSVPASSVVDLENTRATSLSWPDDERRAFTEELRGHLTTESVRPDASGDRHDGTGRTLPLEAVLRGPRTMVWKATWPVTPSEYAPGCAALPTSSPNGTDAYVRTPARTAGRPLSVSRALTGPDRGPRRRMAGNHQASAHRLRVSVGRNRAPSRTVSSAHIQGGCRRAPCPRVTAVIWSPPRQRRA